MEKATNYLKNQTSVGRKSYQELKDTILADVEISDFIAEHHLTQAQIARSISKFYEYLYAKAQFLNKSDAYASKGYQPILIMNEGYADVSYRETAELRAVREQAAIRNRIQMINLPVHLKNATFTRGTEHSVHFDNAGRLESLKRLSQFIANFPAEEKGTYLYGDFGVGKSFIMAALAHDLSEKKGVSTTMLHYPTFTVDIKNAIKDGSVTERLNVIKTAQILVLDDIGAEQHSSWVRDEVLQVILQHRMDNRLPTFFTSNFSFNDLERHFSSGRQGDETWQAKRVMARIRYLAEEIHLKGENRR